MCGVGFVGRSEGYALCSRKDAEEVKPAELDSAILHGVHA